METDFKVLHKFMENISKKYADAIRKDPNVQLTDPQISFIQNQMIIDLLNSIDISMTQNQW